MKALVTGGAGFIGSHLVDALVGDGFKVTVLDNFSTGTRNNLKHHTNKEIKIIQGDIRRSKDVRRAASEVDWCFHLAASVGRSVESPLLDFNTNAVGTLNVLQACKEVEVQRVVVASSVMVYGGSQGKSAVKESDQLLPIIPYGASKAAAEAYVLAFHETWNLPSVALRYFNVYGPWENPQSPYSGVIAKFLWRANQSLPPVIFGDGSQGRDFIYVEDVVRATVLAAKMKASIGQIVNVGSGKCTSINELAREVLKVVGLKGLKPEFTASRAHEYHHLCADMTNARKLLGFKPRVNLTEGLKKTWKHIIANR